MNAAGLEVAPPKKKCQDERCPFHGHLKVRGRLLSGKAVSASEKSFAVVQMEYLHMVPKFTRGERRRSRVSAHVPPCIEVREGDAVTLGECRPLSKTISFVVVESRRGA
ncbi:MAG: 30S ribosomal protein S17 [Nitrososphaerota archaeon]|jgi:small subunit ribosomal protein S17|nr:30S ribosomal protein S17 [Nitrososphaerota archaeon]MDG6963962.1 30S ribosomal protein S17 [Nitrososphaerota archaeon]MDG6974564.1 30S ribosomal protein S17 [Nitrososphaerota archaeon]MDG7009426.1 30S ribosomal protein S17 [Nitrososphaerota archaeon]MDG7019154.1 30S ribosomal protein S17 [Nitrososphaerota archaeon]